MISPIDKGEQRELQRKIESLTLNLLDSYEELDLIYRSSELILSTTDICRQLELLVEEATEIFEADWSWISLADFNGRNYLIRGRVPDPSVPEIFRKHVLGTVLQKTVSRTLENVTLEKKDGTKFLLPRLFCQNLKRNEDVFGVLCIGRMNPGRFFTAGEIKLANVLGTMATLAIQNDMLHRRRREEEDKLIRIQEEMRLASRIQGNLLPQTALKIPGYDIAGRTQPARIVGGDYYDFIPQGEDKVALVLGDVSGKGLPASLLMANLQATIRGQALLTPTARETMRISNRLLYASTSEAKFVTLIYGILDWKHHRFSYSNGGHNAALLFTRSGQIQELSVGGLILGIMEDAAYEEETVGLSCGDLLLLYSDGITEGFDAGGAEYGVGPLIELVRRYGDLSAADLIERIFSSVRNHCDSVMQQDDQTLVIIKRIA